MKYLLTIAICLSSGALFAQQQSSQFIFIVRSKAHINAKPGQIKTNIEHWQQYMGDLAKNGHIAGGYRLPVEGVTISGPDKTVQSSVYTANDEMVSSFLIIKASGLDEAKKLAAQCPVFELQGNVEIRAIQNTAN